VSVLRVRAVGRGSLGLGASRTKRRTEPLVMNLSTLVPLLAYLSTLVVALLVVFTTSRESGYTLSPVTVDKSTRPFIFLGTGMNPMTAIAGTGTPVLLPATLTGSMRAHLPSAGQSRRATTDQSREKAKSRILQRFGLSHYSPVPARQLVGLEPRPNCLELVSGSSAADFLN
jgi:hypothetical protein